MEGRARPEYGRCVDIVAVGALKQMVLPGLVVVVIPVLVGAILKAEAAVVGDTVGNPFKHTAGPSLHVLVKLLSTITLVLAWLFVL